MVKIIESLGYFDEAGKNDNQVKIEKKVVPTAEHMRELVRNKMQKKDWRLKINKLFWIILPFC